LEEKVKFIAFEQARAVLSTQEEKDKVSDCF
jgi:hypothetical protein